MCLFKPDKDLQTLQPMTKVVSPSLKENVHISHETSYDWRIQLKREHGHKYHTSKQTAKPESMTFSSSVVHKFYGSPQSRNILFYMSFSTQIALSNEEYQFSVIQNYSVFVAFLLFVSRTQRPRNSSPKDRRLVLSCLVTLFNGISTFGDNSMSKPSL